MGARIEKLAAQPWADGKRVMISFLWEGEPPVDAQIALLSPDGEVWSEMSVIELREPRIDVTLHLRKAPPTGSGIARVRLLQADEEQDSREMEFALSSG